MEPIERTWAASLEAGAMLLGLAMEIAGAISRVLVLSGLITLMVDIQVESPSAETTTCVSAPGSP